MEKVLAHAVIFLLVERRTGSGTKKKLFSTKQAACAQRLKIILVPAPVRPRVKTHRRGWLEHGIVFFWMSGFFFLLSRFVWKEKEKLIQKKTHVRQQPMFFSFVTRSFVFILPSRWSGSRIPANQREERKTKVKSCRQGKVSASASQGQRHGKVGKKRARKIILGFSFFSFTLLFHCLFPEGLC